MPSADTVGKGAGVAPPPLSRADFDYVQEVIKVAPPVLARLLSFEHLRYDDVSCCALNLLVSWVGVNFPVAVLLWYPLVE